LNPATVQEHYGSRYGQIGRGIPYESRYMITRPFGKTGEAFPILGFGGQRIVDERGCSEEQAIEIVNTAIDEGIRYFDTAWMYSKGQAETRLGIIAKQRRNEMWIASKTWSVDGQEARQQLETSLERLNTSYVNEWRLHNVDSFERLDGFTAKGGALDTAIKAKEEGLIHNISISGHKDPQILVEALNRYPFDSVLFPVSAIDHFMFSFVEELLPVAQARGVATIGMKVFGFGSLVHEAERALRFSLSLPLSVVIVGMESMEQLRQNLRVAKNFEPMKDEERLAFFRDVMPLVQPENMRWKAKEWGNPVEWAARRCIGANV